MPNAHALTLSVLLALALGLLALCMMRLRGAYDARRMRVELSAALQPLLLELGRMDGGLARQGAELDRGLLERFQALQGRLVLEASQARREQEQRLALLQQQLGSALAEARREQSQGMAFLQAQVAEQLGALQRSNEMRLEQMRATVDEKLQDSLERRLGESFRLVSERLVQVQEGLVQMQGLARDVGGLQRVLSNVKNRGVLGEYQLGALLEQYLAPGQYEANVRVRPRSLDQVEFAVKLPGAEAGATVWLPVDSKFPLEDYQRLTEACERGAVDEVEAHGAALERRLLGQARAVKDKYIAPPHTTDFALLFLPFEGLYAEVLRRPGLLERLQRDFRVTLVGPTTLTAFLNSLQVGFQTLAIQRQSGEVWKVLGGVKAEFARFGEALNAVDRKLDEAKDRLSGAMDRNRQLGRRLARVQSLPEQQQDDAAPSGTERISAEIVI